jgi:L-amino acid N-acyltransferase YncA
VHKDHLHSGVGRKLLPELLDACAQAGYRQMISYVDSANTPSLLLHETFGFERAGFLRSIGFNFGQWTDTVILQRALGPGNTSLPGDLAADLGGSTPCAL